MESDVKKITERVKQESDFVNTLMYEVGKVIVGQKYLIERLLIGILSNGHVLLEGVPRLAKRCRCDACQHCMPASRGHSSRRFTPCRFDRHPTYNPKAVILR